MSKKRERKDVTTTAAPEAKDDKGFGTYAAKTAAKLGADICMVMGETLQTINESLASCKTLADFKRARTDVDLQSQAAQGKVAVLVLNMMKANNE